MRTKYEAIADENIRRFGTAIDEYGPQLLADRYSDRTHFVYELLQNAEDAIGWRLQSEKNFQQTVAFRLTPEALYFQHSGLPFAEEHVRGICNIGKGTKGQDLTAIGKHGIGFKSVYAYTHHPEVHSGDEHFVIESFVRPRATDPKPVIKGDTLFVLPFDHPDLSSETAYNEILDRLHSLGLKTLLFLRHISSIQWQASDGEQGVYLRETRHLDYGIEHVTLLGQESDDLEPVEEKWLVLRKEVSHEGRSAGFVEVAFEVESITTDATRPERLARVNESPLVVFFPTEKETHLGFLIQDSYRTTPSRDNVPKDVQWNQHLVSCTADLVTESMEKLRQSGYLTATALDAFVVEPDKFEGQSQAAMFRPIAQAIITAVKSQPLIPRYKSGHVSAACARLARAANVRSLVNSDQLASICSSPGPVRWVTGDITRERMPRLHAFLTNVLKVEEIEAESLVRRMSESFLKAQTDDWIRDLYEFLYEQQAVRRQTWFATKPLVRLSSNSHVTAEDRTGTPRAYLPSKRRSGFPTVKKSVCSTEDAIQFLKQIGLKEPDPVDDVIVNVLPRYTEQSTEYPAEFDDDIERIIEAYQTDSQRRRADLLERLKSAWWIPCRNAENDYAILGESGHNTYLATQKLTLLLAGNRDVWFADRSRSVLQGKVCQTILQACGVAEFLQRADCECDLSGQELSDIRQKAGLQRESTNRLTDYTIEGLETLLHHIEVANGNWQERAHVLWDCLHDSIRNFREGFLFGEYQWSFNRDSRSERIPAKFVRMLRDSAWLPGADNKPRKPSQICFSDLPPDFQEGANETLVSLLEFKPDEIRQLAEKTGIDSAILDLIRDHGLTLEQLRNRLGIAGANEEQSSEESEDGAEAEATVDDASNSNDSQEEADSEDSDEGSQDEQKNEGDDGEENITDSDQTGSGGHQGHGQGGGASQRRTSVAGGTTGAGSGRSGSVGRQTGSQSGKESDKENSEKGSRGHTAEDREGIISRMLRELEQASSAGVAPTDSEAYSDLQSTRTFQSDAKYRDAVLTYECSRGRIPHPKSDTEEGHDIDSYVREKGSLGRKLTRRIEVKGKGVPWSSAEIVELSDRQFADAANRRVEEGIALAADFDYWLYVVEDDGTDSLKVLPIRNPAWRAAHYEFRAGTWRHLAEVEPPLPSDVNPPIE